MNRDILRQMCHCLGGLITILLAFLFFEIRLFDTMVAYIIVGCFFLIIALLSNWLVKVMGKVSIVFFLLEAGTFYYASFLNLEEEDAIVNSMVRLAALLYVVLAIYFFATNENTSMRAGQKRRRSRSARVKA